MHSEDASTPAPTYGTSSSSSSPWSVPSSPNGPCSTPNTASAPSRPPPGRRLTGSPSNTHSPAALDRHRQHLVAGRRDALAHGRRGVQRDVVLGRAPARQDRDPHGVGVGVGSVRCLVHADDERDRPAGRARRARLRPLPDHAPGERRIGALVGGDLEARLLERLRGLLDRRVAGRDVRDLGTRLGHRQLHRGALLDARARRRILLGHGARRRGRLLLGDVRGQPEVVQLLLGLVALQAGELRHLDALDALRHRDRHGPALGRLAPALGRLRDHVALRHGVRERLLDVDLEAGLGQRLLGLLARLALDGRDRRRCRARRRRSA